MKLDLQNCFKNQDDYENNQGAEIFVSETSKEYNILLISKILFGYKLTEYNLVRKHVLIFV